MSIFGSIMGAIFPAHAVPADGAAPTAATPTATPTATSTSAPAKAAVGPMDPPTAAAVAVAASTPPVAVAASTPPATSSAKPVPAGAASMSPAVDVAQILDGITAKSTEQGLDWRKSIVDLMKLLKLDSSLHARKALAQELHYVGDMGDSATMNTWLHKQVMTKLAQNGGTVPKDLMH